jgi:hypothetical protein
MTSRIATINAGSPMRAFLAALLNQAVLKARVGGFLGMAKCSTWSYLYHAIPLIVQASTACNAITAG